MRILCVEDDPNDATLVSRYIKTTPHDVEVAATLAEARAALSHRPDMIMVDVVLGHAREGYSFARELREQGFTQPLIAVTGLITPQALEECRNVGFDFVLTKPFQVNDLGNVIDKYSK